MSAPHKCTAKCWAYMLRYGAPDECSPLDAMLAAEGIERRAL